ncbi:MAG: hypothetical protein R6V22_05240 [Rhodohalobacter sp.]|uniref:hypothetical protein n=1 Tax=Rhodohalobacter sp. TaxID=1974210 RepID=UPI003975F860
MRACGIQDNNQSAEQRVWIEVPDRIEAVVLRVIHACRPDGTDSFLNAYSPINELVGYDMEHGYAI